MESIVKASFRVCSLEDRKTFINSSCLLPISVGQKVHEKEKLLATVNLINRSFKSCVILVDDSIQRHTLKIDNTYSDEEAHRVANILGDEWLRRNEDTLRTLAIPTQILRWDDWLNHKNYADTQEKINAFYNENSYFQSRLADNAHEFLNRYFARLVNNQPDYKRAFELCINYLLEECAVMCLWPTAGYHFEVYPSGRNTAMTATYEMLIKPQYPTLLKSVALRFKKYQKTPSEAIHQNLSEEVC